MKLSIKILQIMIYFLIVYKVISGPKQLREKLMNIYIFLREGETGVLVREEMRSDHRSLRNASAHSSENTLHVMT